MGWPSGEIMELLEQHRFKLQREKKHQVWRNPEGKVYVISNTPSDVYAYKKALGELKRVIGIKVAPKSEPGERREKTPKKRSTATGFNSISTSPVATSLPMRDQLESLFKKDNG